MPAGGRPLAPSAPHSSMYGARRPRGARVRAAPANGSGASRPGGVGGAADCSTMQGAFSPRASASRRSRARDVDQVHSLVPDRGWRRLRPPQLTLALDMNLADKRLRERDLPRCGRRSTPRRDPPSGRRRASRRFCTRTHPTARRARRSPRRATRPSLRGTSRRALGRLPPAARWRRFGRGWRESAACGERGGGAVRGAGGGQ